jgi:hypothetical protein
MPSMLWPEGICVDSFQPFSQPVMVSISGPWAALILVARAVTSAGTFCFFSIMSLISTACAWCGIIICAKVTSAALWSAAGAGALLEDALAAELPWSMGMEVPEDPVPDPEAQPARAMAAAMPVAERVRNFLFMGFRSFKTSAGARAPQG